MKQVIRFLALFLVSLFFSTLLYNQTTVSITNFYAFSNFVEKYGKFEASFNVLIDGVESRTVFNSDPTFNLYDPEIIQVDVDFYQTPSSKKNWPAFFYRGIMYCTDPSSCPNQDYWQNDNTKDGWRIRFTPNEEGTWFGTIKVKIANQETEVYNFQFNCTASTNPGFATISNNLLKYSNGDLTMAIGENIAYHPGNGDSNPEGAISDFICDDYCYNRYAKGEMNRWFENLSDNGGNYVRVWFLPYSWELEPWGGTVGNYDARQNRAYEFDELVESAEKKDLLIQLVLSDRDGQKIQGCLSEDDNIWDYLWEDNPYKNSFNLNNPGEFFTDPSTIEAFNKKVRYIIARWGYSTSLFSFELMNEFDQILDNCNTGHNATFEDIADWHSTISSHIKSFDQRFLTTSSTAIPKKLDLIMEVANLDFSTSHAYSMTMHADYSRAYTTQRMLGYHGKPTLMAETGFYPCWGSNAVARNSLHNTLWSNVFSGSFGTPLYWHWVRNHHIGWSLAYLQYGSLRAFIDLINFDENDLYQPIGNAQKAFLELDASDQTTCAPPVAPQDIDCSGYSGPHWAVGPIVNNTPDLNYLLSGISTSDNENIEVFGMRNSTDIVGWVHNKHAYWYNLNPGVPLGGDTIDPSDDCSNCTGAPCNSAKSPTPTIPDLTDEIMEIKQVCNGEYRVEWYSAYDNSGLPIITQNINAQNGSIFIQIPPLLALDMPAQKYPDYAFKITTLNTENEDWYNTLVTTQPQVRSTIAIPPETGTVFYSDKLGTIHNWKWTPSGWVRDTPLSENNCNSGHIEASESNKIYYERCGERLYQMYFHDGSWNIYAINNNDNSVHGNIAVTPNGQIFHEGTNNQVDHWFWNPSNTPPWNSDILSWNIDGDIEESPSGQVYYRDKHGYIRQLSWNGSWNDYPISNSFLQTIPSNGEITVSPNHDLLHSGTSGTIHHWRWAGQWINTVINPTVLLCGDIEASPSGKIYYHGCDDHIYELTIGENPTSWSAVKITDGNDQKVYGDMEVAPDGSIFYEGEFHSLRRAYKTCGIEPDPLGLKEINPQGLVEPYLTEKQRSKSSENGYRNLMIYPNPSKAPGTLNVCSNQPFYFNSENSVKYNLYNMLGEKVLQGNLDQSEALSNSCIVLNINNTLSGTYILELVIKESTIGIGRVVFLE